MNPLDPMTVQVDALLGLLCSDDPTEVAQGKRLCAKQGIDPAPLLPAYLFRMVCTCVPAELERAKRLARKYRISLPRLLKDSGLPQFELKSLHSLAGLHSLSLSFFAKKNPPRDLSPLIPIAPRLEFLKLHCAHIGDLSPLRHCVRLTDLQLPLNRVCDEHLASLEHLPGLLSLDLSSNPIERMGSLPDLPQLKQLDLSARQKTLLHYPPVPEQDDFLRTIPNLPSLRILSLSHQPLRNLTTLERLPSLQELNLYGTEITDISPLSALSLRRLDVGFSYVRDLSPVLTWPALKILLVRKLTLPSGPCTEQSQEILALRKLRPDLYIQF